MKHTEIVDELAGRIEAGELAPGQRVPSTRQIVDQWGVAMATATKVLAELRALGLVRVLPGIGTVVGTVVGPAPHAPRERGSDRAVTSVRIVRAAIAIADGEGLAAVNMRRVAADIGAATMSLYRHVSDKDELIAQMMDAAFGEWSFPDPPAGDWRERLELAARALWSLFRRHPWLAPTMSMTRPQPIPNAIPYTEWVLAALHGHGLDLQAMFTAHLTLFNYVRGTAINLEAEAQAQADTGLDNEEWLDSQEPQLLRIVTTGRFPLFEQLVTGHYDFSLDELFEFGLARLLDGLAGRLTG